MNKILLRLFSGFLGVAYIMVGFWSGIAFSFAVDRIMAPMLGPIVRARPVLVIVVDIPLLIILIYLAVYLLYKSDFVNLELRFVKQFIKKTLVCLSGAFSFGLAYYVGLQIFVLAILHIKKIY